MIEQNKKLETIKKRCVTSKKVISILQAIAIVGIVGSLIGAICCFTMKDTINNGIAESVAQGKTKIEDVKISNGLLSVAVNYEEFYKEGNYATPAAINCVIAIAITSMVCYLLGLFKKIFENLINEDNPFSDKILNNLKNCFIIITVILTLSVGLGPGVIAGLLGWCIYSIFEYGKVLQTEVDETL